MRMRAAGTRAATCRSTGAGHGRVAGRRVRRDAQLRGSGLQRAPTNRLYQLAYPRSTAPPDRSNQQGGGGLAAKVGTALRASQLEYDNDAVSLDANLIRATSANPAGWFASYHAYPYYPDFMNLDPGYRRARSSEGPSNYFGYLRDLVMHHPAILTLIAEYGVLSSRGIAHFQVQGWHHGGHDEVTMAAIDARLTREIREAGAAGSILFAWLDEWFKGNWAVMDYETPLDNTRLWHNTMGCSRQHHGIGGQYAGADWGALQGSATIRPAGARLPLVQREDKVIAARTPDTSSGVG